MSLRAFLLFLCIVFSFCADARPFTLINVSDYEHDVSRSRKTIQQILTQLSFYKIQTANAKIAFIAAQLADTPYAYTNAMGEGDWQPDSQIYKPHAVHINQNPIYRIDRFDCQTFVQFVVALLYAKDLGEFDRNIIKIAYGAADDSSLDRIHYYNRNHFVDGDFNPLNEQHGLLEDVTSTGEFAALAQHISATLTRQQFFLFKQKDIAKNVLVLAEKNGMAMVHRLIMTYAHLPYPKFISQQISLSYLPKKILATKNSDGTYVPNQKILDAIPTPSIGEIVYDPERWIVHGQKIKDVIGSELTIAHFGIFYRQTFHAGELIYRKITCDITETEKKVCQVTPIFCKQKECTELMFAHATDAYPKGYWYGQTNGNYKCSNDRPTKGTNYTTCNRVERIPFFDYLTSFQFGTYWYMNWPAILGVHIEKLTNI